MKKIYIWWKSYQLYNCGKYKKIEKPKISYLLEKTVLSIICSKCKNEDEKTLKEENPIEILKFLV